MVIEAIPTEYKGIAMRSRLESRIAYLLDSLQGLETTHDKRVWQFEPRSFMLPNGQTYRPDFWVPGLGLWVETRGKDYTKGNLQIESFRANLRTLHPEARAYLTIGPTQALMHITGKPSGVPVVFPCPAGGWAIGTRVAGRLYCLHCQTTHDMKRFGLIIYEDGLIQGFNGTGIIHLTEFIQWMHTSVKPVAVYMAGKIARTDWRVPIVGSDLQAGERDVAPVPFETGQFLYTGPFFTACLHGSAEHKYEAIARTHCGCGGHCGHCVGWGEETEEHGPLYSDVVARSIAGLRRADVVFVWLDAEDAYGTFAEIGIAHTLGKPIYFYESDALPDSTLRPERWFLRTLATYAAIAGSARDAWATFCASYGVTSSIAPASLHDRLAAKIAVPRTLVDVDDEDESEPFCHPHCNAAWKSGYGQ